MYQEGALIDHETDRGKTALINAAEEDLEAVRHNWLKGEDGSEVLAVAFLLDRPIHSPKVQTPNLKSSIPESAKRVPSACPHLYDRPVLARW